MYLVISLAVADIFSEGVLIFHVWFLGSDCNIRSRDLNLPLNFVTMTLFQLFLLAYVTNLAAISLVQSHATFRSFASRLVEKKNWSSSCGCLDNSWILFNHQLH